MSTELLQARAGTVVRYRVPYEQGRDVMWCREGMAIAQSDGRLLDTYWESRDPMLDKFVQAAWADSVEILGNLDDYRLAERGEDVSGYHLRDRLTVTSQHGLRCREYVRKGAVPHYGTKVSRQVEKVREARRAVASAQRALEWAERDLNTLLTDRLTEAGDPR